jgi:hypothetical protein
VRRVLLKARFVPLVCFGMLLWAGPLTAQAAAPGPAAGFAVLSAAPNGGGHVACTTSTIKGDEGSSGAIANVGCTINGNIVSGVSSAVVADFNSVYGALKNVPCEHTLLTLDVTQTLAPGVYCFTAAATATDQVLTLSGPATGVWLFKIGTGGTGALTGTRFSVVMTGGATACNVNWWTAQGATITTTGAAPRPFSGNILAGAGATVTGTAGSTSALTLTGRVWAGAGVTVTDSNLVGCTSGITVPKTKCKSGTGTDTDENSDQSKDTENRSKSESSSNANDEQGNHDGDCKSGDSDKDKSDKPDSSKDDSKKGDSKRSGD